MAYVTKLLKNLTSLLSQHSSRHEHQRLDSVSPLHLGHLGLQRLHYGYRIRQRFARARLRLDVAVFAAHDGRYCLLLYLSHLLQGEPLLEAVGQMGTQIQAAELVLRKQALLHSVNLQVANLWYLVVILKQRRELGVL